MIVEVRTYPIRVGFGGAVYFMMRSSRPLESAHEPELAYIKDIEDWNGRYIGRVAFK